MTNEQIASLLDKQREYYKSGVTVPVNFRIEQLKKLYAAIKKYKNEILQALHTDLGKSDYESFMCEIGLVLSEITYMIRHTKKFTKRKTVFTPITNFHAHCFKQPVPYGNTLIMSPWNYPFLLTVDPLADAIAAGNTAVVKPSAYSPNKCNYLKNNIRVFRCGIYRGNHRQQSGKCRSFRAKIRLCIFYGKSSCRKRGLASYRRASDAGSIGTRRQKSMYCRQKRQHRSCRKKDCVRKISKLRSDLCCTRLYTLRKFGQGQIYK